MKTISEADKDFLRTHIKNLDEKLKKPDLNPLLMEIDDVIVAQGLEGEEWEPNELGQRLQRIYDEIFYE